MAIVYRWGDGLKWGTGILWGEHKETYTIYDIERSFCEYLESNLSKGTGEVLVFEFPTTEIGSHTYSVSHVSDVGIVAGQGRNIEGAQLKGRYIESSVQIDMFRLPTIVGEPDSSGLRRMFSNVSDLFKNSSYIPLKGYGTNSIASTVGTIAGAIKIEEEDLRCEPFIPNPNIRYGILNLKLLTKEVF